MRNIFFVLFIIITFSSCELFTANVSGFLKTNLSEQNSGEEPKPEKIQFDYVLSQDKASYVVRGTVHATGNITIPSIYEGKPVTAIDTDAFKDNTNITGVIIPSSIETVGDNAFRGCSSLRMLTFNEGLVDIGSNAFFACENLESIVLPSTVVTIEKEAFANCTNLSCVSAEKGSLASIEDRAFYNCIGLESAILNTPIKTIGYEAFAQCAVLTDVYFGDEVEEMGENAFENCSLLKSLIVSSVNTISIESSTFAGCSNLNMYIEGAQVGTGFKTGWNDEVAQTFYENDWNKLSFNSVGGSFVPPKPLITDEKLSSLPTPILVGKEFAGWYNNNEYSSKVQGPITISGDTTLYAKWQ